MLLAETADTVGLRLSGIWSFVSSLTFNPVELFEELQRLLRRATTFLPCLQRINEAPPGMRHASQMGGPCHPPLGGVAIAHQDAAVIADEGLRINLAAARLIVEQHDRLIAALSTSIGPHV